MNWEKLANYIWSYGLDAVFFCVAAMLARQIRLDHEQWRWQGLWKVTLSCLVCFCLFGVISNPDAVFTEKRFGFWIVMWLLCWRSYSIKPSEMDLERRRCERLIEAHNDEVEKRYPGSKRLSDLLK